MSNDDSEIKIIATIDASGATKGADEVVSDVNKIGDATEGVSESAGKAEKGIGRMVEEAGTIRESQRVAMGFFDTFEGGGRAVEGAAELMRFFLTTAVELDPPLATLLILIASITTVFMRHGEEAKKSSDAAVAGAGAEKDAVKDLEKQAKDSYGNMLDILKEQTAEYLKQVAAAKELQRAKDELEDAQMAGKIADLDEQEQKDLSGKSEGEQAGIKRDYEKKRIALRQQEAVDKANADLADKQEAEKEAQKAIQDQKNLAEAEGQKLTQAYSVVQGGADSKLAQAGVKSDAQAATDRLEELGKLSRQPDDSLSGYRGLSSEETIEYESLQRSVPKLQQQEASDGKSFDGQLAALKKQKADAEAEEKKDLDPGIMDKITDPAILFNNQQMAADARARADKATAQIQAIEEYTAQVTAAKKVIEDGVPKFQELNNAIPALTTKADAASTEVAVAQQKLANVQTSSRVDTDKLAAQQVREIAKEEYDKRDAERQIQEGALQAKLKDTTLDALARESIQQQIENLKSAGDKDQLDHAIPLGLSDADIIKLKGNAANSQTTTTYNIQAEQKKAAEQQQRLLEQQAKEEAKAAGQEALSNIQGLGGSRQQIQEAHSAITQMDQGHAQGAAQLEQVLSELAGTAKNLTQSQGTMFQNIMSKLQQVAQELSAQDKANQATQQQLNGLRVQVRNNRSSGQ